MPTIFDGSSNEQIQQLTGLINDVLGHRPTIATVSVVNASTIDVTLGVGSTTLKAVPVAGGTNGILQGDTIYLLWFGNQALALNTRSYVGGSSAPGTSPHSHGDLYYTKATVDGKLSGKADVNHVHITKELRADAGYIGGWTIDATGIYENHSRLSGLGYISFGNTPATGWGYNPAWSTDYGVWVGYDYGITTSGSATTPVYANDPEGSATSAGPKMAFYKDANNYLVWTGTKLLVKASNFKLDGSGNITAAGGTIGGWTITATTLHSANITLDDSNDKITVGAGIILDGATQTVTVGSGSPNIVIDGANKLIKSSNYSAGNSGFAILGTDGSAEFNNITARGAINTAVLTYNQVHTTGGSIIISKNSAKLKTDITSVDSPTAFNLDAQDAEGSTHAASQFAVANDILRLKDGTSDLWVKVSSVSDQTTFWRYSVVKQSPAAGTNYTLRAGAAIVNYGQSGQGFLYLTADDTNGPFYSVRTHTGSPWTSVTELGRFGNMKNAFGVGANNYYGFGVGDFAGGNYLKYDSTNGFALKAGAGAITIDATGIAITAPASVGVVNTIKFKDGANIVTRMYGLYGASQTPNSYAQVQAVGESTADTVGAVLAATNTDASAHSTYFEVYQPGTGSGYALLTNTSTLTGLLIGSGLTTTSTPNAMLDVRGAAYLTGNLSMATNGTTFQLADSGGTLRGIINLGGGNNLNIGGASGASGAYGTVSGGGMYLFLGSASGAFNFMNSTNSTILAINSSGQITTSTSIAARVWNSAAITLATSGTGVFLTFDTTTGSHDAFVNSGITYSTVSSAGRFTVSNAGVYLINASCQFASNATGARQLGIRYNGANFVALQEFQASSGTETTLVTVSTILNMAANDYVEVRALQTSGGSLNVLTTSDHSPTFQIARIA